MKKLKIEKMGMNIYNDSELEGVTDLTNFRYYIHNLELKDGRKLDVIEVMNGARYTEKSMKKGKSEDHKGTWFSTYYRDNEGVCRGLVELDKELNKDNYKNGNLYTKKTILDKINNISKIKFNDIEEVSYYE